MSANVIDLPGKKPPAEHYYVTTGVDPIWHPETPEEPHLLRRDLRTLEWLLWNEPSREQLCGPGGSWALNEMTDEVEYGPPGKRQPLVAESYTNIRRGLERTFSHDGKPLQFPDDAVRATVRAIARRFSYSPVLDYLKALPWAQAGTEYLEGLGAAIGLDEKTQGLELEFLRRWLIAAVARVYQPGCQVDTVLVLQGSEGQYKSRFFEELGGRWFVRMSAELGSKDSVETMRRGWIIELDELDAVKRSKEWSTVKAAITRPYDDYVPKWIRESQKVSRRSVLAGTVNDTECLVDEEGLRRFWIVPVGRRIDRDWVRQNRDAIWTEAVAQYHQKEQWHLTTEQEAQQRKHVQQFVEEHPWQQLVEEYLERRPVELFEQPITVQEIYAKVLAELAPRDQNKGNRKTITSILRRLGFVPGVRGHNRKRGWWRHDRPPDDG